jgi:transposase
MEVGEIFVHLSYDNLITQWTCPECGANCKTYDTLERRTWRHPDSCQLKTFTTASPPRVYCKKHGVRTVRVPWSEPNSRFTRLFEHMAILMLQSTQVQSKAAVLFRLSPGQVHDIMHRAVSRGLSRRDTREEITHLSLDEKSFRHFFLM